MLTSESAGLDKATQITVDALGDFSESMRECARSVGKENFFIPGEITGGNSFGAIYRGRQPDMLPPNLTAAVQTSNKSNSSLFIRDEGKNALDAAAFHYSIYRSLTRFLGMDGYLSAGFDTPIDWVDAWNEMLMTNDLINPSTNVYDPRHIYGVSNQGKIHRVNYEDDANQFRDVFRWPAIKNGTQKWLLGNFITTLLMPGIPLLLWGEELAVSLLGIISMECSNRFSSSMYSTIPRPTTYLEGKQCPRRLHGKCTVVIKLDLLNTTSGTR